MINVPSNKEVLYWYDTSMKSDLIFIGDISDPVFILVERPCNNVAWCENYSSILYDSLLPYSQLVIKKWNTQEQSFNTHIEYGENYNAESLNSGDFESDSGQIVTQRGFVPRPVISTYIPLDDVTRGEFDSVITFTIPASDTVKEATITMLIGDYRANLSTQKLYYHSISVKSKSEDYTFKLRLKNYSNKPMCWLQTGDISAGSVVITGDLELVDIIKSAIPSDLLYDNINTVFKDLYDADLDVLGFAWHVDFNDGNHIAVKGESSTINAEGYLMYAYPLDDKLAQYRNGSNIVDGNPLFLPKSFLIETRIRPFTYFYGEYTKFDGYSGRRGGVKDNNDAYWIKVKYLDAFRNGSWQELERGGVSSNGPGTLINDYRKYAPITWVQGISINLFNSIYKTYIAHYDSYEVDSRIMETRVGTLQGWHTEWETKTDTTPFSREIFKERVITHAGHQDPSWSSYKPIQADLATVFQYYLPFRDDNAIYEIIDELDKTARADNPIYKDYIEYVRSTINYIENFDYRQAYFNQYKDKIDILKTQLSSYLSTSNNQIPLEKEKDFNEKFILGKRNIPDPKPYNLPRLRQQAYDASVSDLFNKFWRETIQRWNSKQVSKLSQLPSYPLGLNPTENELILGKVASPNIDVSSFYVDDRTNYGFTVTQIDINYYWAHLMTLLEKIDEIHACLGAGEFGFYDDNGTKKEYHMNVARNLNYVSKMLGGFFKPNGDIMSIRNSKPIEQGNPIPAGWNIAQFGLNKGADPEGQEGGLAEEERLGIVYQVKCNQLVQSASGEITEIKAGGYVLCESIPQYLEILQKDLDKAIDWQSLGGGLINFNGKTLITEGLFDILQEISVVTADTNQTTEQTRIATFVTQQLAKEILKGLGLPTQVKKFDFKLQSNDQTWKGIYGQSDITAEVPYNGIADQSPTLSSLIFLLLENIAIGNIDKLRLNTDDILKNPTKPDPLFRPKNAINNLIQVVQDFFKTDPVKPD